jgi:hypothetical protein
MCEPALTALLNTVKTAHYVHNQKSLKAGIAMPVEKYVYVRGAWLIANGGKLRYYV